MVSMQQIRNTNRKQHIRRVMLVVTFFYGIFAHRSYGTPLNNVYDTQPIYTVFGADKFYKQRDNTEVRFVISPFYQQTSTVRNNAGTKVRAGDRLGQWNLFGVFFGRGGSPTPIAPTSQLGMAISAVDATTSQIFVDNSGNPVPTPLTPALAKSNRYRVGPQHEPTPTDPIQVFAGGLTEERNFDPHRHPFAFVSVPVDYEKIGVRSQLNIDFCFGLGFSVKWGVVDIKQAPSAFIFERQFLIDAGLVQPNTTITPPETPNAHPAPTDALELFNEFMDPHIIDRIAKELDLNLTTFRKTDAEDLHVQAYWHFPFEFKDKAGDPALTMIPYLAAGIWIPIGDQSDPNRAFAVPTGNNGFTAFTADVSMAFDFPIFPRKGQTLQGAFGGGILLCKEKGFSDQRMLTSQFQTGLIPWKIPFLTNRPGLTWYLNLSAKSEEFIEGLSIYFDFLYTKHLEDKIVFEDPDPTNPARLAAFNAGRETFVRRTSWKNQQINIGSNYRLCNEVSLGGAVQAHISGIRIFRSVTLLGGVTITF